MRYSKYMEIAATKDEIKIESLSSFENTAQQHSFWVYLEVMDWKYLQEAHIDPLEWDWFLCNGLYYPVYTEQLAAPADWLRFVSCKCKLFSKRPCSTNCSCEKNGLYCVAACGNCRGDGRHNENPLPQNVADDICVENDKRHIFNIFILLILKSTSIQFLKNRDL